MTEELKTLVQQMCITDSELLERKELLGLTPEREEALVKLRYAAMRNVDEIVAEFYVQQLAVPEIKSIIGDSDTFARLNGAMRSYIIRMFEGNYDLNYANSRLRVGKVHSRIGVPPKHYVASLHLLESLIVSRIVPKEDPEIGFSLHKLFLLDLQFAFDAYINGLVSKVELARSTSERYSRSLESAIEIRTENVRKSAEQDSLSGLGSRQVFERVFEREFEIAKATDADLVIAMLDVDDFKRTNDTFGHSHGDRVIQTIGAIVSQTIGTSHIAFRIGGDEFCIIFPLSSEKESMDLCQRILDACVDADPPAKLSFGVQSLRNLEQPPTTKNLMAAADHRLYDAKAKNKSPSAPKLELASNRLES